MTRPTRPYWAALVLCLAAGGAAVAQTTTATGRTFDFRYRTTLRDLPSNAGKVEVWLPYPESDAHQRVHRVTINAPGPVTIGREAESGNQSLYLRLDRPGGKEIPIEMTVSVTRFEHVNRGMKRGRPTPLTAEERARYLRPDRLVPIDGRVRELALQVTKGKTGDREKAKAIYEHVTKSVKYDKSGQGWGRGDALYVCDARAGNCTDFHALIIGMARAVGIPAKFAIGFPLPAARGEGEIPGYHCWAEIYTREAGWIPVDSSEASKNPAKMEYFFGAHDENRVQFSVGRDLALYPRQAGEPLNFFIYPYVEVDGKPYSTVERKFAFADQSAGRAATRASK